MDEAIRETLAGDPVMARLIETHGLLELRVADDEFERLLVSIINQQLSSASAAAIRERTFDVLGEVTPERVLAVDDERLREAGLSRTKVEYMSNVARAFQEGDLTRAGLADHDEAAVVDELTAITGVGEWTAHMYLIFVLGHEDVLPLGDLGVRRGFEQCYNDGEPMERGAMREIAERWRPYRSYGTRYLWRATDG